MARYCLDANFFIQAQNGPYAMDIFPSFWSWIDEMVNAGRPFSSSLVYDELLEGKDELSEWVKEKRSAVFFVGPSLEAQEFFKEVAEHVRRRYPEHHQEHFLSGADPWIIAQSRVEEAVVVTHEKPVGASSNKPKIPNVCDEFGVNWTDPYKMMRQLGARF